MQTCQDGTLKDFSIVSNELNIDSLTWSIIDVLFKTDLGIMPELTQKDGVDDAECTVIVFCFPFIPFMLRAYYQFPEEQRVVMLSSYWWDPWRLTKGGLKYHR
jgi:hypothetical protein